MPLGLMLIVPALLTPQPASRSRRAVTSTAATALAASLLRPHPAAAAEETEASLLGEIREIRKQLDLSPINALLEEEQWDKVRSIWKVPPVNYAWEQSQNKKNPLRKLADLRDDVELFEVADEVAAALQLADQYCYSNTFIYTQPGNGKVRLDEPIEMLETAMNKLDKAIKLANELR